MANNILEMALERLEPNFSPSTISAWFDDVTVVSFADNRLILHSPVQFKKEIIEQRFIDPLQNVLQELLGDPISVVVVTGEYTAPTASSMVIASSISSCMALIFLTAPSSCRMFAWMFSAM